MQSSDRNSSGRMCYPIIGICSAPGGGAAELANKLCTESNIETGYCFECTENMVKLTLPRVVVVRNWTALRAINPECKPRVALFIDSAAASVAAFKKKCQFRNFLESLSMPIFVLSAIRFSVVDALPIKPQHCSSNDLGEALYSWCDEIWFAERPGYYDLELDQDELKSELVWRNPPMGFSRRI